MRYKPLAPAADERQMAVEQALHRVAPTPSKRPIQYALLIALSATLFAWSRGWWPSSGTRPAALLVVVGYAATGLCWAIVLNGRSTLRPLATGAATLALGGLIVAMRGGSTPAWLRLTVGLGVLAIAAWNTVHLFRLIERGDGPIVQRLGLALGGLLPPSVRKLAAKEVALWTAIFRPSVLRRRYTMCHSFHNGRTGSDVMVMNVLIVIGIIETSVVHLFLRAIIPNAALILLGVSLLTLTYLFGVARSLPAVPTTLSESVLTIRLGVLRSRTVGLDIIGEAEVIVNQASDAVGEKMILSIIDPPNVRLWLNSPLAGRSLFGEPRLYRIIEFRLDDPEQFVGAIQSALDR